MARIGPALMAALVSASVSFGGTGGAWADHRHDHGEGFEAFERGDYSKAFKVWRDLAEAGSSHAQYNMGVLYAQGLGVPQDFDKAFQWYMRAARQGDSQAQVRVGAMYAAGLGVDHDHTKAYMWFLLARAGRVSPGADHEALMENLMSTLEHLHHDLTDNQRQQAEAWAQAWRPSGGR